MMDYGNILKGDVLQFAISLYQRSHDMQNSLHNDAGEKATVMK